MWAAALSLSYDRRHAAEQAPCFLALRACHVAEGPTLRKSGQGSQDYPHTDLYRAIRVSVDNLDQVNRARYMALAVLLDDMPAPLAMLTSIWHADANAAMQTTDTLVDLSLERGRAMAQS